MTLPRYDPTVLRGPNLAESHRRIALAFAERARQHPAVLGVVLLGGAARGFADTNSDIDLVVFVNRRDFTTIPRGERTWRNCHLDLSVVYYPFAARREWTMEQRWTYARAEILHDPAGKVIRLLKNKVRFLNTERRFILIDRIMRLGWYGLNYKDGRWRGYHFFKTPDFWAKRGDLISAHQIMNVAVDLLTDILFAYNDQLIPDEKWKLHEVFSLKWLPHTFGNRLRRLMRVRDVSDVELRKRQESFLQLYRETVREIERRELLPKDIYKYLIRRSGYYREDSV